MQILILTSYIQMSGMILGGWTEADRRLREYEAAARLRRKMAIDRAKWESYEKEYDEVLKPSTGK